MLPCLKECSEARRAAQFRLAFSQADRAGQLSSGEAVYDCDLVSFAQRLFTESTLRLFESRLEQCIGTRSSFVRLPPLPVSVGMRSLFVVLDYVQVYFRLGVEVRDGGKTVIVKYVIHPEAGPPTVPKPLLSNVAFEYKPSVALKYTVVYDPCPPRLRLRGPSTIDELLDLYKVVYGALVRLLGMFRIVKVSGAAPGLLLEFISVATAREAHTKLRVLIAEAHIAQHVVEILHPLTVENFAL